MINTKLQFPNGLDANHFVEQYWQKKPLLMPRALPLYQCPISPDELAGLACEDDTESRIVMEMISGKDNKPSPGSQWILKHGPFEHTDFQQLPESHWTLLVQECNKYVPDVAALLDDFNFIPNWRVDDAMVSYAVPNGSVGAHVDQYDVFLLQVQGQRRWQINAKQYSAQDFLEDCDLRILTDFEPAQDWILSPGDILYLPPGVAHYGVALTECMTISIGFRAPSHYQLVSAFYEDLFSSSDDFFMPRYQDPDLKATDNPGCIDDTSLEKICAIIKQYANNTDAIKSWFGRYITESSDNDDSLLPDTPLDNDILCSKLAKQSVLWRSEYFRFAYAKVSNKLMLYINGNENALPDNIAFAAELFCNNRQLTIKQVQPHMNNPAFMSLLLEMVNKGYYYFADE